MMRTGNPALSKKTFSRFGAYASERTMSLQGTVNRTFFLLVLVMASAGAVWWKFNQLLDPENIEASLRFVGPWMIGGLIGGLIFAMITIFWPKAAMVTAPIYVLCEGAFLGGLSAIVNLYYPGIAFEAVAMTFFILLSLLIAYSTRLIKVTENFKLGVVAATGGIFLVYMMSFLLGMFGVQIPYIHGSGWIGIGFSLFVVIIAALNLVLDFDFIEEGVRRGAPKYMEWFAAFGLMVTLIWLYIEILHLLMKLQNRR